MDNEKGMVLLAARSYLQKDGRYSCVEKQTYQHDG